MAPPAQQQPQFSHFLEDGGAQPTHFVEDGQGAPPLPTPPAPQGNSGFFGPIQDVYDSVIARPPQADLDKIGPIGRGFANFGRGVMELGQPIMHPIKTVQAALPHSVSELARDVITPGSRMIENMVMGGVQDAKEHGIPEALEHGAGQVAGGVIAGETPGMIGDAGDLVRDAAIGDPNAAAVRGLKVPPGSPKMQRTISNVETARPYLQGVKSQAELQTRVPQAKAEIWGPYQQAVDAGKNVQVAGPDGPTTIGQLEQERLQLSALNRGLKMREPEAIQLAQQKGMNQAQLLAREKAIQGALDPELTKMGIKPQEIRKTFGSVAQIGQKVSGKSNIIEPEQPYGFSKLKDISLTKPLSNIPTILSAGRDIAAGRYLSASPIDTGIREGFGTAGPKPDLGRLTSTLQPPPPRALLGPGARPMPAPAYDGRVAGYESPPVYAGTDASRLGRLLPADIPARELPLSSYHEIFPDQIHQARVLDYIRRSQ